VPTQTNNCTESKGRTVHLLKASSKPIAVARKRRKIQVIGSLSQFKEAAGASQQQQADNEMQQQFDGA
jgi:hypothetical protein